MLRLIAQEIDGEPQTNARYLIAPNLQTANQLIQLTYLLGMRTENLL